MFNPTKNYIAGGLYSFTQQIMILQLFEANLEVTKMQVEIQVANLLTAYRSMATCYHYLCYRKPNDTHRNCHHLITASRYHLKKILRNFFNLFFLLPFLIFRWNSRQSIYNGFLFYTKHILSRVCSKLLEWLYLNISVEMTNLFNILLIV